MNDLAISEGASISATLDALYAKWHRRKWLLIVGFSAVFITAMGVIAALPDLYRSSTTILFGEDVMAESLIKVSTSNELELRLGVVRQSVMSRTQLQEVIDKFNLYPNLRGKAPAEAVIARLRKDIMVEQRASSQAEWGRNSVFAITLSYQTWDPELAASVANDLAERFKTVNEALKSNQSERASEFIRKELETARAKFALQESRINEYKTANMGALPEQQQINLATLERFNSELRLNGEKQMQLIERRDALLSGVSGAAGTEGSAVLTGPLRLDRLKRELADLRRRYTDNYPGIIRLEGDIARLDEELRREARQSLDAVDARTPTTASPADIDTELATLRELEQRLRGNIQALANRIDAGPRIDQELKSFSADYESSRDEYLALQRMYQEARLAESLGLEQNQEFKVLEAAIPPAFPLAPNRIQLAIIALVLATGFGGGLALLAEIVDSRFHTRGEINSFTRVPVIASIGVMRTSSETLGRATRFILLAVLACLCIVIMGYLAFLYGERADQLVWTLAG